MRSRRFTRARLVLPPFWKCVGFAIFFLVLEGPMRYFEWLAGRPVNWDVRPSWISLAVVAGLGGIQRVGAVHPAFQAGYRAWLEATPWTYRKPLPLGPVELVWEDFLFLGPLILLSALLAEPGAPRLLCIFLLANLLALIVGLLPAGQTRFFYLSAFSLGFAVAFWRSPVVCLTVLAGTYLIAYEGTRRGLAAFPWKGPPSPSNEAELRRAIGQHDATCGWPHDLLMRGALDLEPLPRTDVVLSSMLLGFWALALTALITDPRGREIVSLIALVIVALITAIGRTTLYVSGHQDPISFWGRLRTFRWIVPNYDRVFVAPLCALLAAPATVLFLTALGVPTWASHCAGIGMVALVALITPPSLRNWRLTGGHRIVNIYTSGQFKKDYTRAG